MYRRWLDGQIFSSREKSQRNTYLRIISAEMILRAVRDKNEIACEGLRAKDQTLKSCSIWRLVRSGCKGKLWRQVQRGWIKRSFWNQDKKILPEGVVGVLHSQEVESEGRGERDFIQRSHTRVSPPLLLHYTNSLTYITSSVPNHFKIYCMYIYIHGLISVPGTYIHVQ